MTLFERIKKLSNDRSESLKSIATKLGFGENYFYSWKTKSPSAENLQKVADYFNVSTDYLLGRTDVPAEPENRPFDTLAAHAANRDHKVTDEEISKIEAYLDGLIDAYEKKNKGN